jgi:hypothetical protein
VARAVSPSQRRGGPHPARSSTDQAARPGTVSLIEGTYPSLVFTREPERRHPDGTFYVVPPAAIHPKFGICYHLTSDMVMHYQVLRTTPRRRLFVVRRATAAESLVYRALQLEWVAVPRGFGSKYRKVGYHRWLCCISASQIGV